MPAPQSPAHRPPSETAQELFTRMLREQLAPALRERGLRGSGQTYTLADDRWWLIVGFQRSRYSSSACLEFTVHAVAIDRDVWDGLRQEHPRLGARPAPSDTGLAGARRLDQLDPTVPHVWWSIDTESPSDTTNVVTQVLAAVDQVVLPWLLTRSGRRDTGGTRGAEDTAHCPTGPTDEADEPLLV